MASDIQTVLQEAFRAQECEDDGDIALALESYYKAACQLSYFADLHTQQGTAVAGLCQGLVQQYEQRMAVLRSRQEATGTLDKGPQWVQLEQLTATRAAFTPDFTSSAATSTPFEPSTAPVYQQLGIEQVHQQQAVVAAAAGAGGLQHMFEEPASSAGSSAQLDLLHTCQRTVSGSLDDVVGLEAVKLELEEAIFLPLEHSNLFQGIRQPARTFLLYGPPGTGKTLLVEKVAAEAGFMLLSLSPSMILSKWAGDSEKAISGIFDIAKSFQPCIIFLDEVDSLGQSRGANTDAGARRLLTELLIQFTRAAGEEGVYVFGATNRMQDCDPALLRRFSRRIEVPLPDTSAREAFFQSVLSRPEIDSSLSSEDLSLLVQLAEGYSGSDLADLCRTAALAPVRELLQQQGRQLGRKRRRTGMGPGLWQSSRVSEDSCPAAGLITDSTACTDLAPAAAAQYTAATAGPGGASAGPTAVGTEEVALQVQQSAQTPCMQLRPLVMADFQAALALVKPAAADAGLGA